ncbi:50S ribosomal protein L6 [Candidatus Bathyarchaeota archaeon]|nr:50S ribosomal protein L6 [Candidatus Bathyarchaeota archaeon]
MATNLIERRIPIPDGVNISVDNRKVKASGVKGEIIRDFSHARVKIELNSNTLRIWVVNPKKKEAAVVNTLAAHIKNMIKGVTGGFTYKLKVVYVHFPMTINVQGNKILLHNFLGEKKPRETKIVGHAKVTIKGDEIIVEGIDVEEVGQTAANIQRMTKIKAKDPRKFLDGIYIQSKG